MESLSDHSRPAARFAEHALGVLLVGALFALLFLLARDTGTPRTTAEEAAAAPFLQIEGLDFGDPLHRELFAETVARYYPGRPGMADSLLAAVDAWRAEQFTNRALKTGAERRGLSADHAAALAGMYARFLLVYLVVQVLTYYGAQTLGTYRFVRWRQRFLPPARPAGRGPAAVLARALAAAARGGAYAVLFAPAYVVAYSLRTRVDTDSLLFMVLLGTVTNGVLMTFATRFSTLLAHESRKGYVETAAVKGLSTDYRWRGRAGVAPLALLRWRKSFPGHVLQHIFLNARYQSIPAVKEHAAALITGLVIIEMALNIQGHLCYELLQKILERDYEVVLAIVFALFLTVKLIEAVVDLWHLRETRKYENRA